MMEKNHNVEEATDNEKDFEKECIKTI